jgi:hypothetical protein
LAGFNSNNPVHPVNPVEILTHQQKNAGAGTPPIISP